MEKTCLECGIIGADKRCGACHTALYCSAKCQRTAWKKHKLHCMPPTIENKNDGASNHYDFGECPLCFESLGYGANRFMPCCGEVLCMGCSSKWTEQCAFCRTPETDDPLEIAKRCRKLAVAGRAIGQERLGGIYYKGQSVEKDVVAAVRWFRLAANQGSAEAQTNLGVFYSKGEGVVKNHAEAGRCFRLAANQGSAEAQYYLGVWYSKGEGVVQNHAEAVRWLRLAADQCHADAQCGLGMCYFHGHGVGRDVDQAAQWYKRAAQQGHEEAKKGFQAALEVIKARA